MTFKELLLSRNLSGYRLSKSTGIPYMTINDLVNGKTSIENVSLKNARAICSFINIDINQLLDLDSIVLPEFRYFRNNLLSELKRVGHISFINEVIRSKSIDYYYKNNGKEYALYLLALTDYLSKSYNVPIYHKRYNALRKQKLDKPFFVGSNLIKFDSIGDAEKALHQKVINEFKKYNIIEVDVSNVA